MRYLLIGKSKSMKSVLVRQPETGKWYQRRVRVGVRFELDEEEMTDHIWRQASLKILQIIPIEEEEVVEKEVVKKETKPKKSYSRKVVEKPQIEEKEEKEDVEPLDLSDSLL